MSPVRPTLQVVGHRLDPAHHRLRDFLTRGAQPHEWFDADGPEAGELLHGLGLRDPELPLVVDGTEVVTGASVERLAERWGLAAPPLRAQYDVAVVGAGPAGLAAAVYAASDGLSTLVVEREVPGGQASHTSMVENFFGFPDGIGGAELARRAGRQAEKFGAELVLLRGVRGSRVLDAGWLALQLADAGEVSAAVTLVAPGMEWRRLEVDGVEPLIGRGIYYGAGRSEATQCGGDDVVVVGAGNSAGQAVLNLGNAGARVQMLVRGDRLGKTMSAYLVERIEAHPLIRVRLGTEVSDVYAGDDGALAAVAVRTADGGLRETLPARALFLCIGGTPRTGWAAEANVLTSAAGYVLTGVDLLAGGRRPDGWPLDRDPLPLETSVPGVFAAGDVRHGSTKRVAGAVGDGAMAATMAFQRLQELGLVA